LTADLHFLHNPTTGNLIKGKGCDQDRRNAKDFDRGTTKPSADNKAICRQQINPVATRQLSSFINSPSFINNSSLSSTLLSPLTVARAAYWLLSGGYREVVESSGWVEHWHTPQESAQGPHTHARPRIEKILHFDSLDQNLLHSTSFSLDLYCRSLT
jgi:hypothetical protein